MKKLLLVVFAGILSFSAIAQSTTDEALASQYYQNGDYDKAIVLYRKLFTGARSQFFYEPYLNTMIKLKQFDEADKAIKKLIKSNPEGYNFKVDYGRLLAAKGEEAKAETWYDGIIKDLPKNENAARTLSTNFYKADLHDYAVKTLLAGRKLMNDDNAFAYDLISLYRFQKNKPLLVQEYLNLIEKNAEAMPQAQGVIAAVFEDNTDYDMLKTTLLRRLQKDPQNVAYAEMLTWQFIQQKDYDMALRQAVALDKRLKEPGDRIYDLSWLLLSNKAFSTAVDALEYLIGKGKESQFYLSAKVQMLNTKNQMLTSTKFTTAGLQQLEGEYLTLLSESGKVSSTAFAMRQLANLQAFYLNKPKDAEALLEQLLLVPNLTEAVIGQAKLDLGDVYILTGEVWEANLIYGQVEKQFADQPMGQEAKFRNAKLSYYMGDFDWAKTQLDVLKASTSQLIANDALNLGLLIQENTASATDTNALKNYARADLLIFKNQLPASLASLDSINIKFPKNSLEDDILMAKAKVYLKQNDYQKAVTQLQTIADNHKFDLWADDAVFMLADLYENKLNDPEKAKVLYQKIITDYPGSLFVIEARKRFRNLRGDKLGS